jgi:cytochrome P450
MQTIVAIWQWAICHNAELWASPYTFRPERFMGNPDFAGDALEALQPFSVGTRNCIGRNLSYAETRLILARFIYNFDFQLADPSQDWFSRQKAYLVWDPPPLYVLLKPVVKRS